MEFWQMVKRYHRLRPHWVCYEEAVKPSVFCYGFWAERGSLFHGFSVLSQPEKIEAICSTHFSLLGKPTPKKSKKSLKINVSCLSGEQCLWCQLVFGIASWWSLPLESVVSLRNLSGTRYGSLTILQSRFYPIAWKSHHWYISQKQKN